MISLAEACHDEKLIGLDLWPGQEKAAEAIDSGSRILVMAMGRRSGKTAFCRAVAVWDCLFRPELGEYLRPGERRWAVVIATNRAQARIALDAAKTLAKNSPMIRAQIEAVTEDEIRFKNGTGVRALPCSSRSARGLPVSTLILDELAHFQSDEDGFAAAEQVWTAMTPSVAQFGHKGLILAVSTPYGTEGLFANLFSKADDGQLEAGTALKLTSAEANPTLDADFLESEREREPETYAQEYEADFLQSGNAFIDMARVPIEREEPLVPGACLDIVCGLDPAFSKDAFGIVLVGRARETLGHWRLIHADAQRLPNGESGFNAHMSKVVDLLRTHGCRLALTDQFASAAVYDALREQGIECRVLSMSAESKSRAYTELRGLLYDGSLELYRHPKLVTELGRLRTRFTPGKASVYNPRVGGSHGDVAQALALCAFHLASMHDRNKAESVDMRELRREAHEYRTGDLVLRGEKYIDQQPGERPPRRRRPQPRRFHTWSDAAPPNPDDRRREL